MRGQKTERFIDCLFVAAAVIAIVMAAGVLYEIVGPVDDWLDRLQQSSIPILPGESLVVECVYPTSTPLPTGTLTPTPTSTPLPTETPTPEPTGKMFGPMNFPPTTEGWPFNFSRLSNNLVDLQNAKAKGFHVLVALTGGKSGYTDSNGCFSLQMWKNRLDANDLAAIQPYVDGGTIVGLYAIDEPHDWTCGPTFTQLDELCTYARQKLPDVKCGFNAPPAWLAGKVSEIDYILTQSNFGRTRDWVAWATEQAGYFPDLPLFLSMNVVTYEPTPAQIREAGIALCNSRAIGVTMWKYPDRFSLPGMKEAMETIADACAGR